MLRHGYATGTPAFDPSIVVCDFCDSAPECKHDAGTLDSCPHYGGEA
jgi:hypothetical protein